MQNGLEEPKGIEFFNVRSGESHYAKLEPTIAAYINSSDMGINASRGQDFGWKLGVEWVRAVRAFRRDTVQMSILTARNGGTKPTTVQVLYHLYEEQLRAYYEEVEENEAPFEEQYRRDIARSGKTAVTPTVAAPDDLSDLVDDDIIDEGDLEEDLDTPPPVLSPEEQAKADEIALAEMEAEEKAALEAKEAAEKAAEAAAPKEPAKPAAKPATPKKN